MFSRSPEDFNKKKQLWLEVCLFLAPFNIAIGDVDTLFSALISLPKGDSKVSWKESPLSPLPLLFKGLLGEGAAAQLLLHPGDLEEVAWCQIRRIGDVVDRLDLPGRHPVSHHGGSVH